MIQIYLSKSYFYIKYYFLFFNIRVDEHHLDFIKTEHPDIIFKNHGGPTHIHKIYKENK